VYIFSKYVGLFSLSAVPGFPFASATLQLCECNATPKTNRWRNSRKCTTASLSWSNN